MSISHTSADSLDFGYKHNEAEQLEQEMSEKREYVHPVQHKHNVVTSPKSRPEQEESDRRELAKSSEDISKHHDAAGLHSKQQQGMHDFVKGENLKWQANIKGMQGPSVSLHQRQGRVYKENQQHYGDPPQQAKQAVQQHDDLYRKQPEEPLQQTMSQHTHRHQTHQQHAQGLAQQGNQVHQNHNDHMKKQHHCKNSARHDKEIYDQLAHHIKQHSHPLPGGPAHVEDDKVHMVHMYDPEQYAHILKQHHPHDFPLRKQASGEQKGQGQDVPQDLMHQLPVKEHAAYKHSQGTKSDIEHSQRTTTDKEQHEHFLATINELELSQGTDADIEQHGFGLLRTQSLRQKFRKNKHVSYKHSQGTKFEKGTNTHKEQTLKQHSHKGPTLA